MKVCVLSKIEWWININTFHLLPIPLLQQIQSLKIIPMYQKSIETIIEPFAL